MPLYYLPIPGKAGFPFDYSLIALREYLNPLDLLISPRERKK